MDVMINWYHKPTEIITVDQMSNRDIMFKIIEENNLKICDLPLFYYEVYHDLLGWVNYKKYETLKR